PAQRAVRRTDDVEAACAVEDDIIDVRLQQRGGDLAPLVDDALRGADQRAAAQHGAPAARCPDALRRSVGDAGTHAALVGTDAHAGGHDLGERGLVALSRRARARRDGDAATALHADGPALPACRARLDVGRDADAVELASCPGRALLLAQLRVADGLER